ncbi:MAG: hypothetical protein ABI346_03915 [Candidatus Baltobacteraceae bacterium]
MARGPDHEDPLAALRRLLRDLRNAARLPSSPIVERLCPRVPLAQRQAAVASVVKIALYRLPSRQRELLKRYDLEGESAADVQDALGLSPRQFFRDRHAALLLLNAQLLGPLVDSLEDAPARAPAAQRHSRGPERPAIPAPPKTLQRARSDAVVVGEAELVRRTLARSLYQSGDIECLRVFKDLALQIREPARRADLLLDLADAAAEYDEEAIAQDAGSAVARIVGDEAEAIAEHLDYLSGRLARTHGRLGLYPGRGRLVLLARDHLTAAQHSR